MARTEPGTGATRTVVSSVDIQAPGADVWKALTEAHEVARWFAPRASGSGNVGDTLTLDWGRGIRWDMPVIRAEANRLLIVGDSGPIGHERRQTGTDTGAMRIEYALESRAGSITRVTVTHSGFGADADWNEIYDGVDGGWFYELRSLKHYVEHFFGRDRRVVSMNRAIGASKEKVWERLLASLGIKESDAAPGATPKASLGAGAPAIMRIFQAKHACAIAAIVPGLGDAMLRFSIESCAGTDTELWVWLSAHDAPAAPVEAFEREWTSRIAHIAT